MLSVLLWLSFLAVEARLEGPFCPQGCSCSPGRDSLGSFPGGSSPSQSTRNILSSIHGDQRGSALGLNCRHQNLTEFPLRFFNDPHGPHMDGGHIVTLILSENLITEIDFAHLEPLTNLQGLFLAQNRVRSISKTSGEYKPFFSVVHIDLSWNKLHVIHSFVLVGFPSLKTLNLSGNAIHTISASAFALPSLETLDLSGNALEEVHGHFFATSPKLSEIDLSHNRISRVNDGTFGVLTHLSLLDVSHNSLMKIEDNVLVGMNITHLDLGFNALRKIPSLPLRKLTKAQTLLLDGNHWTILPPKAMREIRVEFLSISHCPHLQLVGGESISGMATLETLTLNNNPLMTYIHPGAISSSPRLRALDLSNNNLFALEVAVAEALPSLRALFLSGNNFYCHCNLAWLVGKSSPGSRPQVKDINEVDCQEDPRSHPRNIIHQMNHFHSQCEPFILPLFPPLQTAVMGQNISWLCKALGSEDMEVVWRLKSEDVLLANEQCSDRACVQDKELSIRYLHPSDSGQYVCIAKNKFGQDQREIMLEVKSETIQIFPITVASTFVTLSWNTSGSLSTGRGYILRVKRSVPITAFPMNDSQKVSGKFTASFPNLSSGGAENAEAISPEVKDMIRQYEDIDVGLKMNSYTVNGLSAGHSYIFELCLRRDKYVIPISSTRLTTKSSDFQVALGIETDYVSLFVVSMGLISVVGTCVLVSGIRLWRFHRLREPDSLSQREMITSPSDHSSMNCGTPYPVGPGLRTAVVSPSAVTAVMTSHRTAVPTSVVIATGDESRLMDHEVTSPIDDPHLRETIT